jgi:UDP-hydrolysing UDP-N-acetyl-D-glucosamine 2-epimerase
MKMRKICIFVGSRANYSSIKSVMTAVKNHSGLKLQLVLGASALLNRFGKVENLIEEEGFFADYRFFNIVEGDSPVVMAKSAGLGIIEMSTVLNKLNPDFVVVVGDRFEMIAVTIAAAYMNIRVVHTMGGEITGTIDESIRHAITKLSHIHFAANLDAKTRIIKMGENPDYVYNVGCPRIDLVAEELKKDSFLMLKGIFKKHGGVGEKFDLNEPFLFVSQHSVTTEYSESRNQIEETLEALRRLKMPTIMLWPNIDAGSDHISKGIRTFRENHKPKWLYLFKNLPIATYIHFMNITSCLIGNSSSGIRECSFIGTPVVNIGSRQNKRKQHENVVNVGCSAGEIQAAVIKQLARKKYQRSDLYGNGKSGEKIADILFAVKPEIQKTISY